MPMPQANPHLPAQPAPDRSILILAARFVATKHLIVYLGLILIFVLSAQPITDTDFWWHLRTGQYILETRSVPHTDIFSSIRFGGEWIAHEWLAEVAIYSIFKVVGFVGLIAVFSLIITAAFLIVYKRCLNRSAHSYIALGAVILGAVTSISTWGVRPHIFSILFASFFLFVLECFGRAEKVVSIWWLIPLMVIWVNTHAGFFIGLGLIALTIIGRLFDQMLGINDGRMNWRDTGMLLILFLACSAVVPLNPSGFRLYTYPLETLTSPGMMRFIEEWRSPNFHEARFQGLALLLIGTACSFALSRKRIRISDLLMFAAIAWATLRSGRNVWLFALVAVPMFAESVTSWLATYFPKFLFPSSERPTATGKVMPTLINATLLLLCVVLVVLAVRRAGDHQPLSEVEYFPVAAVKVMQSHQLPQPIFNEYDWGGYLIWKLYPSYRVYIDGRADVYGEAGMEEYLKLHEGDMHSLDVLKSRGVR